MCKARRGRASRHHSPANSERLGVGHGGACFPGKRGLGRDSNYCESIARRNSTRGIVERVSCRICATFPTYHLYWYLFLIPADGAYKQKSLEWYPCRPVLLFLSRDSLFAQQIAISFCVQVGDGPVDSGVEGVHIGKRLVGEIEGFEVMPDHFDVVEL